MGKKATYEELEQRVKVLERRTANLQQARGPRRESEERYRNILQDIGLGYYETDISGNITFSNVSLCSILGYPRHELIGMNNRQIMNRENAKKVYETFNRVYNTGNPDKGVDWEMIRKNGTLRNIEASVALIKDKEGLPIGFRGIVRDITERKLADNKLREKKRKLEVQSLTLEQTNAALRVLLKKRQEYKAEQEEKVNSNMKELVMPYLEKLKSSVSDKTQKVYMGILESNLNDIISPYSRRLSSTYLSLSPTQVQVASLVRDSKTTKEIAELLNLSEKTIEDYRKHIRKKLGIMNKKVNLRSYLLSIE